MNLIRERSLALSSGLTRSSASCLCVRALPEACRASAQGCWPKAGNAASSSEVSLVLLRSTLFCAAAQIPQRVDSTQLCGLSGCMASSPPIPTIPEEYPGQGGRAARPNRGMTLRELTFPQQEYHSQLHTTGGISGYR